MKNAKTKYCKISDLKIGDRIKTVTPNGSEFFTTVRDKWDTVVKRSDQVNLTFSNGTTITCSVRHPIMTLSGCGEIQKQTLPLDLVVGETKIVSEDNKGYCTLVTRELGGEYPTDNFTDITVDGGTFFAKKNKLDTGVLTHNCSQGGVRGASATLFYPWWHYEFPELIVLKNTQGTEENRERHLDYGVEFSRLVFDKYRTDESVCLFSPHDVPEMTKAFYSGRFDDFKTAYEIAVLDKSIRRRTMTARELIHTFVVERFKVGRIYTVFMENFYNQSSFMPEAFVSGAWLSSNLCVAPETNILTSNGYFPIAELEGEKVEIWNGEEFSETTVVKTGEGQRLLTVKTSSGQDITATPYHKFYVFNGYGKPCIEKRLHELSIGDKLIKFKLPVIKGSETLEDAYTNGFYSGDGCLTKEGQRVYLYHEKRSLSDLFTGGGDWIIQEKYNRQYKHYNTLEDKFFVPSNTYTVDSRLEWLSGWLDADGCVYRNGTNEAIVGASVELQFLKEIQLMLQTLGVNSKISTQSDAGFQRLPANDGTGEMKEFWCSKVYRLLISSCESFKLLSLGLNLNRLKINKRLPQRDANQFIKVTDVVDEGRVDDTYCVNEPKRHMAMFNGLLTGQCLEIALPVYSSVGGEDNLVALCTLSSVNFGKVNKPTDLESPCRTSVQALDALLSYQEYPVESAKRFTELYRALGIGLVGYAHFLAKRGLKYNKDSAEVTDEYMEAFMYYLIDESVKLAEEFGPCEGYKNTCYGQGIFPWERRNKNVDLIVPMVLRYNWEELRVRMLKFGIRNATLSAIAPTETSSQLLGETNGIEPPRKAISTKISKTGILKQVVPQHYLLKNKYDYLWDQKSTLGYLSLMAVMQKWVDQSISSNTSYRPDNYPDSRVPMSIAVRDIIFAMDSGVKTLYYNNVMDSKESTEDVIEVMEDNDCCVV